VTRVASSFALVLAAAIAGCSSAPPPAAEGGATPSSETTKVAAAPATGVTVVGWSLRDQAPVPVKGVLRQGGRQVAEFDTKARPDGTTVSVAPGPYEIEITQRYVGDRLVAASGLERVDARGSEIVRCEVVVDDRDGQDTSR